jgi:hypothetical protein
MIKSLGIYRINKQVKRRQAIRETVLVIAATVLFYVIIGIIGHYEFIDYCVLHNITCQF